VNDLNLLHGANSR